MRRTKWSNVYARKKMCDASQSTMEIRNKLNNTLFISFHCTIDWSNCFVRISFHSRRKTAIKRFLWLYFRLFKHHFRESFFAFYPFNAYLSLSIVDSPTQERIICSIKDYLFLAATDQVLLHFFHFTLCESPLHEIKPGIPKLDFV